MMWFNSEQSSWDDIGDDREWLTDTVVNYTLVLQDVMDEIPETMDKLNDLETARRWVEDGVFPDDY